jgi:hypothetical protein
VSRELPWQARLVLQPANPTAAVKAALLVLLAACGRDLTYREIVDEAIRRGLWCPEGETPINTLARDLRADVADAAKDGVPSLFVLHGGRPTRVSLDFAGGHTVVVDEVCARMRAALTNAQQLHPREFELLIGSLLWRMGYRQVVVTPYWGDGGLDATASFACGPISTQRFVFQVKRQRRAVTSGVVRELRGVLEDDVQGVLVATGGFSPGARELAEGFRRPIELIDGQRLAELLVDHGLELPTAQVSIRGACVGEPNSRREQ